jgi:hypothetical protein
MGNLIFLTLRLVRVFTVVESRIAPEEEARAFAHEADVASLKGAEGIDEKTIQKFATIQQMAGQPGKKEGEMKVFRDGKN